MSKFIFAFLLYLSTCHLLHSQNIGDCTEGTASDYLDINNVQAQISNIGNMWFEDNDANHKIPKDGPLGQHISNASALWIGAIDDYGGLSVAAEDYGQNSPRFFPGPINDQSLSTDYSQCQAFNRLWKVHRSTIDAFLAQLDLDSIQEIEIYEWPAKGNPHLNYSSINQDLAPFIDVNGDDIYNPDDGDYPKILGDQSIWTVFNTIGNTNGLSSTNPFSLEIHLEAFAFDSIDEFQNSTFYKYTIYNKSTWNYSELLVGRWMATQLGNFQDDYWGCDTTQAMAIVYNADDYDEGSNGYGDSIPMFGLQFIQVPDGNYGTANKIYSFMDYGPFGGFDTPYLGAHYYNYMQGIFRNETEMTYGGDGVNSDSERTNYLFPSDPTDPDGWSACSSNSAPGYQHLVLSTGKYDLPIGSKLSFVIGAHATWNVTYPCPSFDPLKDLAMASVLMMDSINDNNPNTQVHDLELQSQVYPNPASNILSVESEAIIEALSIFNFNGQMIYSKKVNQLGTAIDVSEFKSGTYILKLSLDMDQTQFQKIIISR